jgi:Zn-dependent peptidase ImmA (M78 family)
LVADHLYAPGEDRILPATDAKTARQKFRRSFAQEFLCPFDDLRAYIDDRPLSDEIIEEAADYFQVSPLLTKTTLVNRGLLSRDALELYSS